MSARLAEGESDFEFGWKLIGKFVNKSVLHLDKDVFEMMAYLVIADGHASELRVDSNDKKFTGPFCAPILNFS